MQDINTEIVCNIILKARELGIEDDLYIAGDPESPSTDDWKQILAEYQEDLTYTELKNLINDLEPDQQDIIIALMYMGRGDFDKDQIDAALEAAKTITADTRADYLISKPLLADYLQEGLAKFGYSCDK